MKRQGGSSPGLSLLISLSFIRQREFQHREKREGRGEKSLIFYSHTFLCTSGLTTGLREPDECKASEESRVKRKPDQNRDTIRESHKSRVLMAGEYALKDHLDFPTSTFILSCLRWDYAFKDRIFISLTTLKEAQFMLFSLSPFSVSDQ